MIFSNCASIALGLWVGGLSLFLGVVTPVSFRRFGKEEGGQYVSALFPAVDRWGMLWGGVACGALYAVFLNRHFVPLSLMLEIPVAVMYLLTLHAGWVLHPQITDLRRRIADPKYAGTAHLEKLRYNFARLHKRSVQLHGAIIFLGWFSLGLLPRLP